MSSKLMDILTKLVGMGYDFDVHHHTDLSNGDVWAYIITVKHHAIVGYPTLMRVRAMLGLEDNEYAEIHDNQLTITLI